MIEDENMQKANRITVLRAKREYQMIKQARQQKQQQMQQQQQQKVKKIIEQIEGENKVNEYGKRQRQRQRYRSVICVTTGEVFNTIKDAVKKYKVHSTNVSQCCRGNVKHTGKLPDGTPLEWRYIDLNNKQN